MIKINEVYDLQQSIKGWPVEGAGSLKEAAEIIFGSPYWDIPEDRYIIIDKNDTYSLAAVFLEGRVSTKKRYLVVNMDFMEHSEKVP